jgi:hypothetical protein
MATTQMAGGSAHVNVRFRQRASDGQFGYLFCKSDVSGRVRSFAVGIKTAGGVSEVWVFYLAAGQINHELLK